VIVYNYIILLLGIKTIEEKIDYECPEFKRMDALFGERQNVRPTSSFSPEFVSNEIVSRGDPNQEIASNINSSYNDDQSQIGNIEDLCDEDCGTTHDVTYLTDTRSFSSLSSSSSVVAKSSHMKPAKRLPENIKALASEELKRKENSKNSKQLSHVFAEAKDKEIEFNRIKWEDERIMKKRAMELEERRFELEQRKFEHDRRIAEKKGQTRRKPTIFSANFQHNNKWCRP